MVGLSSVVGMGITDRIIKGATRLGTGAAEVATSRAQHVGSEFKALRAILADGCRPTNVETFLSEREIAAHMLVMWSIVEPLGDAEAVMAGRQLDTLSGSLLQ
jgi:hypothetical protein